MDDVTDAPPGPGAMPDAARSLRDHLRGTARVEVYSGPAHETDDDPDAGEEPWAVLDDPDQLRALLDALTDVDLSPCKVLPALAGVRLVASDSKGGFLTSVELLSPRWVRYSWPYDALAAQPVLPTFLDELSRAVGTSIWDRNLGAALDEVEPRLPASASPASPGIDHAQPGDDAPTLCGLAAGEVTLLRHTFFPGEASCPQCSRLVWTDPRAVPRRKVTASALVSELSDRWRSAFPGLLPIAHRWRNGDRWVRFHTLPASKRYPNDENEYAEILRRHGALLSGLRHSAANSIADDENLLVVTTSSSSGPTPVPRSAPVARTTPAAEHWQSVCTESDDSFVDDFPTFTHLFVDRLTIGAPELARLFRLVADERAVDVFVCDQELNWLYHPYDGGADIVTRDPEVIRQLRGAFHEWLPKNPAGL